jgi:hypothetical protein
LRWNPTTSDPTFIPTSGSLVALPSGPPCGPVAALEVDRWGARAGSGGHVGLVGHETRWHRRLRRTETRDAREEAEPGVARQPAAAFTKGGPGAAQRAAQTRSLPRRTSTTRSVCHVDRRCQTEPGAESAGQLYVTHHADEDRRNPVQRGALAPDSVPMSLKGRDAGEETPERQSSSTTDRPLESCRRRGGCRSPARLTGV